MSSQRGTVSGAASGAIMGAKLGSIVPGIGNVIGAIGGGLLGALGGMGGRSLPKGVMSGTDARKLFAQGLSVDEILAMGPVGTFHPGKAMKAMQKAGISQEDAFRLLSSSGVSSGKLAKKFPKLAATAGMGGFGAPDQGPMSMNAFNAMMPAIMGNDAAFINSGAQSWLQSLFPGGQGPSVPVPQQPSQFPGGRGPMPLGMPGGFNPWRGFGGKPGPSPDPMVGLRALAGPFGNGGGAMVPYPGQGTSRAAFRGLMR